MMNRQNRKDRCTGRDLHIQASRILRQIPVGQHDTFTFSGRTGGKHNRTKLIRFRFIRISSLLLFKKLPERICLFILFRFLHGNQGFQLRTSIFYNCRHICADLIQHQDSHICPIDQLTHLLCRKRYIQRNRDASTVHSPHERDDPRIGCHTRNRNVSSRCAKFCK